MNTGKDKSLVITEQEKRLGILDELDSEGINNAINYVMQQLANLDCPPIKERSYRWGLIGDESTERNFSNKYMIADLIVSSLTKNQSIDGLVCKEMEIVIKTFITNFVNRERAKIRRKKKNIKLKSFEISPKAEKQLVYLKNQKKVPYSIIIEELLLEEAEEIKDLNRELAKQKKIIKELNDKLETQRYNSKAQKKETFRLKTDIANFKKKTP